MFERFTQGVRIVMGLANQQAIVHGHDTLGTSYILLGLIKHAGGQASMVLRDLGIGWNTVYKAVHEVNPSGASTTSGKKPLSPRAKKAIEYAIEEARDGNYTMVNTGLLLCGLCRATDGTACRIMSGLGVRPEDVLQAIRRDMTARTFDSEDDPDREPRKLES